jgi:hypothetical protein
MRRMVVTVVLVELALFAVVWVWPAFSEPPHRPADCEDAGPWGYDVLGRSWTCNDNWLVRVGNYGVAGI